MTEIPRHREADPIEGERGDGASRTRWVGYVLGAVVAAVFVLVVVLHLTGVVGPGAH